MRVPIFVKVERFDLGSVAREIEGIRGRFDVYLESYPAKNIRSKHGLMGPVGKVLQEVRTGKWDADSLAGFALNVHLSNPKAKGSISDEARTALRQAIGELLELLERVPATAHDRLLDRIDYGLYFVRRSKGLERLESIRRDFAAFLQTKYGTPEELAAAWGGKPTDYGPNFGRVPFPSRRLFDRATGRRKLDIAEYAEQAHLKGYELPEDGELEEELR